MRLPKLKYWFTQETAPVALQTTIALAVGVISIYSQVPGIYVVVFGTLTFAAVVWSWKVTAEKIGVAAEKDAAIGRIMASLTALSNADVTPEELDAFKATTKQMANGWHKELSSYLSPGQLNAVFHSPRDRVVTSGYLDQEHKNMIESLLHYHRKLSELVVSQGT
ncbi:hypothetical protein ACCS87_02575 [Rhizobium ruizarguesonis]